jgi:hypothetical protein
MRVASSYSIPYRVLTVDPTLNTTWFMVSCMVRIAATAEGVLYPSLAWSSSTTSSGTTGANARMAVGFNARGQIGVASDSTVVNVVGTVPTDQWFHMEYRHRYGNTGGNYEVYINGALLFSGAGDSTGAPNPRYLLVAGGGSAASYTDVTYDDMVVATSNDVAPALLSRCAVRTFVPTSTSIGQWVGSDGNSVDNHLLVNSGSAASATSVSAAAGTGLRDLYGHDPAAAAPLAVQARAAASLDAIGTDDFSLVVRSASSEALKRFSLGTGTATWRAGDLVTDDPATSTAWTKPGFDASTFGVKA